MKTIKRIIIRIVVAVAVAVILSKLKLLNIIEVSALDYSQFAPTSSSFYFDSLSNSTTTSNVQYNIFNTTFWGHTLGSSQNNIQAVSFNYTFYNQVNRKDMNASFLLYIMGANSFYSPTKVYIQDDNKNISTCEVQNSNVMLNDSGTSGSGLPLPQNSAGIPFQALQVVSCKNVLLTTNYKVFVTGPFQAVDGNVFASSPILFFRNNEIETRLDTLIDIFNNNQNALNDIKNNTKETNDLIKSDDTTESNSKGKEFFDEFDSNSHGLSGIITAPFRLLNSLTTQGCSPLNFDLPFELGHVSLPCMRGIYEQHFGIFFSLWQMITTGLISYNVILNIYSKVRQMQNPNNDRIEVLNL